MSKTSNSETQERLRKEKTERDAKMAKQKADRLAAEDKKADELEQHAKRVAALYKSMREFEAHAEEKAGFELKKAAEKRAALEQALVKARELCKAAGEDFKAFQEKYAPNYKRTRLYQVLAIADGRTTVEEVREGARDRKRRQRAGQSSVTEGDVTDSAAEGEPKPAPEMETPGEPAAPVEHERSLAKKLFNALNEALLLCADQNNWLHLSNNKKDKDELRAAVKKLKVVREALPRLAIPRPKPVVH